MTTTNKFETTLLLPTFIVSIYTQHSLNPLDSLHHSQLSARKFAVF